MYLSKILEGLCSAAQSPVEEQGLGYRGDTGRAVTACCARGDVQERGYLVEKAGTHLGRAWENFSQQLWGNFVSKVVRFWLGP